MKSEAGEVISSENGFVTVRMKRSAACARCRACEIGLNDKEMLIKAKNNCAAEVNDRVSVELKPEAFLSAALILYGLPFAGLIIGFAAGYYFGMYAGFEEKSSLIGFTAGIALAWLAYALIRRMEPRFRNKNYTPEATEKINTETPRSYR